MNFTVYRQLIQPKTIYCFKGLFIVFSRNLSDICLFVRIDNLVNKFVSSTFIISSKANLILIYFFSSLLPRFVGAK